MELVYLSIILSCFFMVFLLGVSVSLTLLSPNLDCEYFFCSLLLVLEFLFFSFDSFNFDCSSK